MYTSTGMPGKDSLPVPWITEEILLEAVRGYDPQVENLSSPRVLKVWQTAVIQYQCYSVDVVLYSPHLIQW